MARKLESVAIHGPAGRLEALLEEPEDGAPQVASLVCHPHPLYGGTMHNKVVYRLARGLRTSGAVVLRFNFRGVGLSEGVHDNGVGEIDDAGAALEWLRGRYPSLPVILAGFSFGARVVLSLGCALSGMRQIVAAGFPTRMPVPEELERCRVPKAFIQSTRDQYGPREELEAVYARIPEPKQLVWVEAQDHFFEGALEELENAVRSVVKSYS